MLNPWAKDGTWTYDEASGTYTEEILGTSKKTDYWASRWFYTGLLYDDHSNKLSTTYAGMGAVISSGEQIARNFDVGEMVNLVATYQLNGGDTWDTATSATNSTISSFIMVTLYFITL